MQLEQAREDSFSQPERNIGDLLSKSTITNPLETTLAKLTHLDLSGQVTYNNTVLATHGGYSDIFVGEYSLSSGNSVKVAVKRLRIHAQGSHDFAKQLAKEMNIWSELVHPNILVMLGFVLEGNYPCLVSEWMENGTLAHYMADHPKCDVVSMLVGTANGLAYLHTIDIIHSDIKADNVLVSQAGEPLICDFGISWKLSATHTILGGTTSSVKGSIRWMSPEILVANDTETTPPHTKASDVWAFGMLVYELLTGKPPFHHLKSDVHVVMAIILGQLPSRLLDSWPHRLDKVWSLCQPQRACWDKDADQRPPMAHILFYLELCLALTEDGSEHALADFATEPWMTRGAFPTAPKFSPTCTSSNNENIHGQHGMELETNRTTCSFPTSPVNEAEIEQFDSGHRNRFFERALSDYSASTNEFIVPEDGLIPATLTSIDGWSKCFGLSSPPPIGAPLSHTTDAMPYKISAFRLPELPDTIFSASAAAVAVSSTSHLEVPAVGELLLHEHNQISLYGRQSSSLERSQNLKGDAPAFPLLKSKICRNISIFKVLDQIQKVGYAASVEEVVATISTILEQASHSGTGWKAAADRIRMEVFGLFRRTFSASSNIRLFSEEELKVIASSGQRSGDPVRAHDTDRALDVTALLVELVKLRIVTSSDLVTAAALLYEHRRRQGYMYFLYLLLEAGKDLRYTYSAIKFLMGMKHDLQAEKGPMVDEISALIDTFRSAPHA